MSEKECKIVKDLLPNYIENLTSEETSNFISNHIGECKECNKVYLDMKTSISANSNAKSNKEVKYLKKYNQKLQVLKVILILVIAIFIIRAGRNAIIVLNLTNKAEKFESSDCYYKKTTIYDDQQLTFIQIYNKGKNGYCAMQTINSDQNDIIKEYKKGNSKNVYAENEYSKNVYLNSNSTFLEDFGTINYLNKMSTLEFLQIVLTSNIKSKICNGKECYYIAEYYSSYIDKETGLLVRNTTAATISPNGDTTDNIIDYRYSFDDFNDKIFEEPDISEYKIIEENNG